MAFPSQFGWSGLRTMRSVQQCILTVALFSFAACGDSVGPCSDICWTSALYAAQSRLRMALLSVGLIVSASAFKDACDESQRRSSRAHRTRPIYLEARLQQPRSARRCARSSIDA